MASYSIAKLKERVNKYILENYQQLITGAILNGILHDLVDSLLKSIIASDVAFNHPDHKNVQAVIDYLLNFKTSLETEKGTKGFTTNDYTNDDKSKLDSLNEKFQGKYTSLVELQAAHPIGAAGQYADVDAGVGQTVQQYIWDAEDGWVTSAGGGTIASTDELPEGATNKYFSAARAIGSVLGSLAGLTLNVKITAEDTIKTALAKLQGQLDAKADLTYQELPTVDKTVPGAITEIYNSTSYADSKGYKTILSQNKDINYSIVMPADSDFLSIEFRKDAGNPSVKIGTTLEGNQILDTIPIADIFSFAEQKHFNVATPLYITVTGGTVTSNVIYFNKTFSLGQIPGVTENSSYTHPSTHPAGMITYTNAVDAAIETVEQGLNYVIANGGGGNVPDVTVQTKPFSVTVDFTEPNQITQQQLTGATVFAPALHLGILKSGYKHTYILDLNGVTPTFSTSFKNFLAENTEAVPNLTAGYLNTLLFFKEGSRYYYAWIDSYAGTLTDTTAPTLSSVSISNIAQITAQINATSNETSTFYWGVYANGATTPTYAQLIAGTGSISYGNTSLTSSVAGNDELTGLVYSTAYDVYYAATDGSGNHTEPVLVEFNTIARAQLATPNPTGAQLDADTARFTWSNIVGNAGYSYRSRINSGTWSGFTSLAANTTQLDIDATTGQTVGFELIAKGNNTTTVDSASSTEDSVTLTANQAPVASNVQISGSTGLGATLTGSYDYSDAENNSQGTSTYRWLRNGVAIAGETAITHTIVLADQGTTLTFEVTTVAVTGTSPGAPVQSAGTSIPANAAPVLTAGTFTGTAQEGQTLTGVLGSYSDADGNLAGTHTHQWFRADNNSGLNEAAISGATALNYTIVTADVGKYLKRRDIPVAATGASPGTPVNTAFSAIITASNSYPLTNLLGYYPLNGNANMADGTLGNGTVIGTPTLVVDRNSVANKAYSFTSGANRISIPLINVNYQEFTITCWVKLAGNLPQYGTLLQSAVSGDNTAIWTTVAGGTLLGLDAQSTVFGKMIGNKYLTLTPGTWQHLAWTYKSTTNSQVVKNYLNGVLIDTQTAIYANHNIAFGAATYLGSFNTSYSLNGALDDVFIYNKELTITEINQLKNYTN